MDRDTIWRLVDRERLTLVDLLATLDPDDWRRPSLCAGWTVRDLAAHLSVASTIGVHETIPAMLRARGNLNAMIDDITRTRGERSPEVIIADLHKVIGSRRLAPMTFLRDPLLDLVVHGQDLVRPLGRVHRPPPEAVVEAADWVWRRRPAFPSTRPTGVRFVADDHDWSRGEGPEVRGPLLDQLLVITGRPAGLDALTGPGVSAARDQLR